MIFTGEQINSIFNTLAADPNKKYILVRDTFNEVEDWEKEIHDRWGKVWEYIEDKNER